MLILVFNHIDNKFLVGKILKRVKNEKNKNKDSTDYSSNSLSFDESNDNECKCSNQ